MAYFAYYIPNGPKNLETFFPGVDFATVAEYYIDILSGGNQIAVTPMTQLDGECCEDKVRIHFLNYLGAIDALNFKLDEDEHEAKSDLWQRPTKWDPVAFLATSGLDGGLVKSLHGGNRFNVKANNTLNLILSDYEEKDMKWINELIDSPLAWIEWVGIEDQDNDYLPIIVSDAKIKDKKSTDAYINDVPVSITYSHAKIIIRN